MSDDLTVDMLTAGELKDLESLGRIKDGKVLPAPSTSSDANVAGPIEVMPAGVKQRMEVIKELNSSFVATNEKGEVKKSEDGGKGIEAAGVEYNPDWATKAKEDPVDASDKAAYLAHILGAPFFEKSYDLFGGAAKVTFRTISQDDLEQCSRQAWNDDRLEGMTGKPGSQDADAGRQGRYQTYKFVGELYSIAKGSALPKIYKPFEEKSDIAGEVWPIKNAWAAFRAEQSSPFLVALRQAHLRFEYLVARLTLAADRPDFWKADSGT